MTERPHHTDSLPIRALARSLPMALLKGREAVMVRFRPMLRAHGLTEQQWRVLRIMAVSQGSLRPMDMAQMAFISMPSLSRLLKTLEAKALIRRERFEEDLRGAAFSLTPAALSMVQEIAPQAEEIYAEIDRLVGTAHVQDLYRLLELVVQRLGEPVDLEP